MTLKERLQTTLFEQIPITKLMGIKVEHYDGQSLTLAAPLAINSNDKNTAFGGSLATLTTLSGWGLLFLKCTEAHLQHDIVIQASNIQYLRPITSDFKATCQLPNPEVVDRFFTSIDRKLIGRISLTSLIIHAEKEAVRFTGKYVVRTSE